MMIITIVLLEVGLRLFGFGTYELPEYSMVSSPNRHLSPDANLGIHLNPGTFAVTINKQLKYTATHLKNGQRTCGEQVAISDESTTLAFYGCSFTYGTGVNDWEVYPHIIQQQFPDLKIENHAVPGYGQAQIILDLEKQMDSKTKPGILILNYLSFHNERNTMNSAYQQKIRTGYAATKKIDRGIASYKCSYSFGAIENGSLKMGSISIQEINSTLPLINYSASMNAFQNLFDKSVDTESDEKVTLAMIDRIHEICEEKKMKLVLSYMTHDAITQRLVAHCKSASIPTIDIFVDLNKKGSTNAPYDSHPSAKTHQVYAEKLSTFLRKLSDE
ncbi:MAG: hypothetical protein ACJA0U_003339 [Salibacteraceae bacterium]|jgi:hypothetical protein